ncbi:MAG: DUF2694 domain-containing protein [Mycolicibacterium sp.]|uniref:DUF2694 domain-containing protein n=1 Tax=Mycolicibacterium sp. TaxID=2320850 RepID=UPI003D14752E
MLESAQEASVEVFEATSCDDTIIVCVDRNGASVGVQLEPKAMDLADAELASRIIRLNTLAYLRSQLALRLEMEGNHVDNVGSFLPTEDQVAAFATTIDF